MAGAFNLIIICIDSLRKDHVAILSEGSHIQTPHLDQFARNSVIFENFCINAIPTIPFRRALMLGRPIFPFKDCLKPARNVLSILGWQPLANDEITLQEVLQDSGYATGMVTDVYHYFRPGMNLHRGFHSWQFIRGQEGDPFLSGFTSKSSEAHLYAGIRGTRMQNFLEQHLRNFDHRLAEEDYAAPQVFRTAERWLERNADYYNRFFLYIDCFDPHEPWDPPRHYREMYDAGYEGRELIFPQAGSPEGITPKELKHIKALYAAEVTMVDRWFGKFMEKYYDMGLDRDTAVLVLADHGHPFGEHGIMRKLPPALYWELLDVPMMLMTPGDKKVSGVVKGLVQECDIAPTLLKRMGLELSSNMNGLDFWPLVTGEQKEIRDFAVGGYHTHAYIRNQRHHYFRHLAQKEPRYLFSLKEDPLMTRNLAEEDLDTAEYMENGLIRVLDGWNLPSNVGGHSYHMPYIELERKKQR